MDLPIDQSESASMVHHPLDACNDSVLDEPQLS
jgi:hypothetical protein